MVERERILNDIIEYSKEQNYSTEELVKFINGLSMEVLGEKYKNSDKIYVLKNRGIIEEFDPEKVYYSLANITYKGQHCMTESEIYLAIKYLENSMKQLNRCVISTNEIRKLIAKYLEENGRTRVVNLYNA
ncbi:ATP cone domain-containing protein [Miniphocaeibacter massiliensis]|uniref:ATP cone domain-containing protein n=1 Tax=Miniphocaeibacter massiliensis TaxID=2041841 RepID=UPI0013EB8B0A|nr:ATP cone domain-containing protein [Miniphocaeibacter massiliensis]